jgi:hypothetical protein
MMATLGISPIQRVEPERKHEEYGKAMGAPARRAPPASPSYHVDAGNGVRRMVAALLDAGAVRVRLSMDEVRRLLGRTRPDEPPPTPGKDTPVGRRTAEMFRAAVAVEEWETREHAEKETATSLRRLRWAVGMLLLGAGVFLLTIALLDAAFGTHALAVLWQALAG